ncbi:hypothetical protein [Streptomyces sp. NPDC058751]|uniref:hypothetical protein n=1 Tax=Streptomyces sp. NPDC058751 TaxID=3346623 RepID=UPI00369D3B22
MTRHPAPASARTGRVLVTAALAALALCGCGGSEPGGDRAQGGSAGNAGSRAGAASPAERAAFAAMLAKVARPCSPAGGNAPGAGGGSAPEPRKEKPTGPTGPSGEQSLPPGESPPSGPIEPGALPAGPEDRLNDRDRCASVQHEQRIIEALQRVSAPTPAMVRETLNGLGYIDERIHGLEQDGGSTRFHLDLREKGGRLCEAGLAAGERTDVTVCAARATGAFTVTGSGSSG